MNKEKEEIWFNCRDRYNQEITGPGFSFHGWVSAKYYGTPLREGVPVKHFGVEHEPEPNEWIVTLFFKSEQEAHEAARKLLTKDEQMS